MGAGPHTSCVSMGDGPLYKVNIITLATPLPSPIINSLDRTDYNTVGFIKFFGPQNWMQWYDANKYIVSIIVESWGHTELMSNHDSIPQLSWLSSFQSKLRTSNVRWFDLLLQFLSHVELLHFFHIFLLLLVDGSLMILQIGGVDKIISRLELEISRQNFGI